MLLLSAVIPATALHSKCPAGRRQSAKGAHPHYDLDDILGAQVDHVADPQHDACMPQRFADPLRLLVGLGRSAA
jgi:hypothetical protein